MNTKEVIVKEAIDLFKKTGFDEVSIPMICEKANISKGTFYYHFQNKSEIMYEYVEQFLEDDSDIMVEVLKTISPREQLWKLYSFSFDHIISLSPSLLKAYYLADIQNGLQQLSCTNGDKFGYHTNNYTKLLKSLVEKGQACHEIREELSADDLTSAYSAIITGVGLDWSCHKGIYDEKEYLKRMFDVIF